jgi:hypothetical protein
LVFLCFGYFFDRFHGDLALDEWQEGVGHYHHRANLNSIYNLCTQQITIEPVLYGDTLIHSVQESESHPRAIVATLSKLGRKSRTGLDPYCGCSFPRAGHHKSARACWTPKSTNCLPHTELGPLVQSRLP